VTDRPTPGPLARGGRLSRRLAVLAVCLSAAGLPACGALSGAVSGGYKLTAYFPRALSLYHHSDVRVLGLSVGKVTAIVTEGDQVRVDMSITPKTKLPDGVQAAIMPQSLIGERFVQLYPAWVDGQPLTPHGTVIPLARTTIPVEPDEALAALKRLFDNLDPNATGRLIKNLSDDLSGNGQNLNNAISGLAQLSTTLADKDQQLAGLVDNFDAFTAALSTHEQQLGTVMDEFAQVTSLLAQERDQVAGLVHNLATLSTDALDLVSKHSARLETDVGTITTLLRTVDANLGAVSQVLSAAPTLVAGTNLDSKSGLIAAYNHKYHRIDLRDSLSPAVAQLLGALGVPGLPVCLPIDVACTAAAASAKTAGGAAQAHAAAPAGAQAATKASVSPAAASPASGTGAATPAAASTAASVSTTPIDGLVSLLGSPGVALVQPVAFGLPAAPAKHHRASGMLGWLSRSAHRTLGQLW
jgi:phospholipid/cholesterol/gamma-HCH transport system substrate-binding protein